MKPNIIVLCILCFFVTTCGSDKVINGVEYETYGLINANDEKVPNIKYKPIWGNIIWSVILFQTIVSPIYFLGFSMFEPVGIKEK